MIELENQIGKHNSTWFKAPWIFTECYMYRRIREAILICKTKLKDCDVYIESKKDAYSSSEKTIVSLIDGLCGLDVTNGDDLKSKNETLLMVSGTFGVIKRLKLSF